MRIGLDIDGTITANPDYFADLSQRIYAEGGSVVIITSRLDIGYTRLITSDELNRWSIRYDTLHLFRGFEETEGICPHLELDWYRQYLWLKVHHAINERLDAFYDDDDKVISLFKDYAQGIEIIDAKTIG